MRSATDRFLLDTKPARSRGRCRRLRAYTCAARTQDMVKEDGRARPAGRTLVAGMKIARRIVNNKALDRYRAFEMNPGDRCQSDDELLGFARQYGHTAYHVIGTCKMGHDPRAVVDDELRVHGLASLRVVDASILPTMTSGNTNAPVIMIAEKAADMVKATASRPARAA